jgi:hypothetical protein
LEVDARIQVFVPERDNMKQGAELITGRWLPRSTLSMSDDGTIWSIG